MSNIKIQIRLICDDDELVPEYESDGAVGFDLKSSVDMTILAGATVTIPTGIKVELPKDYEIQVRPRSGRSAKSKLRVSNSPGTIDSDYRGEVMVIVDHIGQPGSDPIIIKKYDRVAQGVLAKVPKANFWKVDKLSESRRGENGLGSTGN